MPRPYSADLRERALRPLQGACIVAVSILEMTHFLIQLSAFDVIGAGVDQREPFLDAALGQDALARGPVQCSGLTQRARLRDAIADTRVAGAHGAQVVHR